MISSRLTPLLTSIFKVDTRTYCLCYCGNNPFIKKCSYVTKMGVGYNCIIIDGEQW